MNGTFQRFWKCLKSVPCTFFVVLFFFAVFGNTSFAQDPAELIRGVQRGLDSYNSGGNPFTIAEGLKANLQRAGVFDLGDQMVVRLPLGVPLSHGMQQFDHVAYYSKNIIDHNGATSVRVASLEFQDPITKQSIGMADVPSTALTRLYGRGYMLLAAEESLHYAFNQMSAQEAAGYTPKYLNHLLSTRGYFDPEVHVAAFFEEHGQRFLDVEARRYPGRSAYYDALRKQNILNGSARVPRIPDQCTFADRWTNSLLPSLAGVSFFTFGELAGLPPPSVDFGSATQSAILMPDQYIASMVINSASASLQQNRAAASGISQLLQRDQLESDSYQFGGVNPFPSSRQTAEILAAKDEAMRQGQFLGVLPRTFKYSPGSIRVVSEVIPNGF